MGPTYDIQLAPLSYSTPTSTASSYSHSVQPMQEFHVWCLSTWHALEFPFLNKCRIHFRVSRFFRTSNPSPPSLSLSESKKSNTAWHLLLVSKCDALWLYSGILLAVSTTCTPLLSSTLQKSNLGISLSLFLFIFWWSLFALLAMEEYRHAKHLLD